MQLFGLGEGIKMKRNGSIVCLVLLRLILLKYVLNSQNSTSSMAIIRNVDKKKTYQLNKRITLSPENPSKDNAYKKFFFQVRKIFRGLRKCPSH